MQSKPTPDFADPMSALDAGIAEANRREFGDFAKWLGQLDPEASWLLRDILTHLRDYLLDRYSDDEARRLLTVFEPRPGFRNMPVVDDDVLLAIDLLNMFRSVARCTEHAPRESMKFSNLIFGTAGARDRKRQAGTRKERRPKITKWIAIALERNPDAKVPELWRNAPEWLTEQIGMDRFRKRVSAVRKMRRK